MLTIYLGYKKCNFKQEVTVYAIYSENSLNIKIIVYNYSVSCGLSAAPTPLCTGRHRSLPGTTGTSTGTGDYRHKPALTGLDRHKTGADQPGLFYTHFVFYDVFDKNFQNIIPFWAI
jgi:hypothetical protein